MSAISPKKSPAWSSDRTAPGSSTRTLPSMSDVERVGRRAGSHQGSARRVALRGGATPRPCRGACGTGRRRAGSPPSMSTASRPMGRGGALGVSNAAPPAPGRSRLLRHVLPLYASECNVVRAARTIERAISRNRGHARPTDVSVSRKHLPPFEQVIEIHGPAVLRFCAAQAGSARAEDCFQETMLAALRAYDTGARRRRRSARGCSRSRPARPSTRTVTSAALAASPSAELEPPGARRGRDRRDEGIWREVRSLPDKQRSAVALRYLADLSHREIAEVMRTTRGRGPAQRVRGPQAPARARRADRRKGQHEHDDDTHREAPLADRVDALAWDELAASSTSGASR